MIAGAIRLSSFHLWEKAAKNNPVPRNAISFGEHSGYSRKTPRNFAAAPRALINSSPARIFARSS